MIHLELQKEARIWPSEFEFSQNEKNVRDLRYKFRIARCRWETQFWLSFLTFQVYILKYFFSQNSEFTSYNSVFWVHKVHKNVWIIFLNLVAEKSFHNIELTWSYFLSYFLFYSWLAIAEFLNAHQKKGHLKIGASKLTDFIQVKNIM